VTDIRFDGLVAVITGAGAGLGRQYALELGRRGASIVVNDIGGDVTGGGSDPSPAEKVAAEIIEDGGKAVATTASVATVAGGKAIIDHAVDAFGRVDVLINNAGILRPQAFADLDFDILNAIIDVHLKGAFYVTQPAFKLMQQQKSGAILNTTSGAVFGVAEQLNYAAAKGGVLALTRGLAVEGAEYGVRANAIMPIATTRMTEQFFTDGLDKLLIPDYVAPFVTWLVHPDCRLTGEIFSVGGGHMARVFLGETEGWTQPDLQQLSAETVRDNFEAILDPGNFSIPTTFWEEMELTVKAITYEPLTSPID
jgi:NAD(P)-dependent dehydrogenase (short-subunit alcohol dehydrogenase family)